MSAPIRLQLRVSPGASRAAVVGRHGSAWKVRVAAPPEQGRANDAVVALLAEALALPRHDIAILAGHGARDKTVTLAGISAGELAQRLERASAKRGRA